MLPVCRQVLSSNKLWRVSVETWGLLHLSPPSSTFSSNFTHLQRLTKRWFGSGIQSIKWCYLSVKRQRMINFSSVRSSKQQAVVVAIFVLISFNIWSDSVSPVTLHLSDHKSQTNARLDACMFVHVYLADSFHSNSPPSCCSVSISVNNVGVGVLSSSLRMWRSRSAAGDTRIWRQARHNQFHISLIINLITSHLDCDRDKV